MYRGAVLTAPTDFRTAATFDEIRADAPDPEQLASEYGSIEAAIAENHELEAALAAFTRWDALCRSFKTWEALTELRYRQEPANALYKREADLLNTVRPKVQALDATIKRRLLASPLRAQLTDEIGSHPFALWEADLGAYDSSVEALCVRESTLEDEYTALLAGARFDFRGERLNQSTIVKYAEHPDREVRRAAAFTRWEFLRDNREQLDRLYDELVHVRDRIARTLGYANFTEVGYRRMRRTDYGPRDVARYREAIRCDVLPLAQRIAAAQARDLGVDELMIWDEKVFSAATPPAPPRAYDAMIRATEDAFAAMDRELGTFLRLMLQRELVDLMSRDGKGGGGFCTTFPDYGLPFVFANLNGTTHDVNVVLHEMGHAFQCYSSRAKPAADRLWPTSEACEIHSMSMEFLAWPQLERFFGADAERYRGDHLKSMILALPYIAAVDEFQHFVYEHPNASPAERNAHWKALERTYLPWRRYGGIPHCEDGGFWQAQLHIYRFPFYYIDYGLAACCALQFWSRSLDDYAGSLTEYEALCERGGDLPFQALVRSAGLRSPLEDGALGAVMQRAGEFLNLE